MERSEWIWRRRIQWFCSDFEQKWPKIHSDLEKKIEDQENLKRSFKENTEEWNEANKEAVNIREELRVQFELRNSYEELRNRLENWEEDKQWKAQEEMKRREEVITECPTILEDGGIWTSSK